MGVYLQNVDGSPLFPKATEGVPFALKNNRTRFNVLGSSPATGALAVGTQRRYLFANMSATEALVITKIKVLAQLAVAPATAGTLNFVITRTAGVTRGAFDALAASFLTHSVISKSDSAGLGSRANLASLKFNNNTTSLAVLGTESRAVWASSNLFAATLSTLLEKTVAGFLVLLPGDGIYFTYTTTGSALTITDYVNIEGSVYPTALLPQLS